VEASESVWGFVKLTRYGPGQTEEMDEGSLYVSDCGGETETEGLDDFARL
jgi:hypothetical protein